MLYINLRDESRLHASAGHVIKVGRRHVVNIAWVCYSVHLNIIVLRERRHIDLYSRLIHHRGISFLSFIFHIGIPFLMLTCDIVLSLNVFLNNHLIVL